MEIRSFLFFFPARVKCVDGEHAAHVRNDAGCWVCVCVCESHFHP